RSAATCRQFYWLGAEVLDDLVGAGARLAEGEPAVLAQREARLLQSHFGLAFFGDIGAVGAVIDQDEFAGALSMVQWRREARSSRMITAHWKSRPRLTGLCSPLAITSVMPYCRRSVSWRGGLGSVATPRRVVFSFTRHTNSHSPSELTGSSACD